MKHFNILKFLTGLFLSFFLFAFSGCQSHNGDVITQKTLEMHVEQAGSHLIFRNYKVINKPFYDYKSSSPLYEAELFNKKGEKLHVVLFGKIFFLGNGPEYDLTFPYYKNLGHIIVYQLDPNSGHITNKNHQIALSWELK